MAIYASATFKEARAGPHRRLGLDFYSLKVLQINIHHHLLCVMCFSLGHRKSIQFGRVGKHGFGLLHASISVTSLSEKVAPSNTDENFSMQFNVHTTDCLWNISVHELLFRTSFPAYPPRPSPPECRIDDVEWPLGFFFTTFSIRQRDNDHGYFVLLLLHLAQMPRLDPNIIQNKAIAAPTWLISS